MYEIQANAKGSRYLNVDERHLITIEKYALFQGLVGSTGVVDDHAVEKLRLHVRSLIETHPDGRDLVELCEQVLYHDNMKSFGLGRLMELYAEWSSNRPAAETDKPED